MKGGIRFGATAMAIVFVVSFVGCKSSDGSSADAAGEVAEAGAAVCDPLAALPIMLGTIVGVGQDAAGTFYVDAANGIFVSDGGKLVRQHVSGTGQMGADEYLFTFGPADGPAVADLLVETDGSVATAMALGPLGMKTFLGQSDAGVTSLSVVASSAVAGMAVVNTANVVQYVGDVTNGDVVLATVPVNVDSTPSDSRVDDGDLSIFYGPPTAVAQRTITAFEESKSGNGTLTFQVDDVPYVLAFGTVPGPDAGPLGMFALESLTPQGSAALGVTLRTPTPVALPPEFSFTCLP